MVIIKITGGLGNQMFQYAFAIGHLKKEKVVKLDVSYYEMRDCHQGLELYKRFNVKLKSDVRNDLINAIDEKGESKFKYISEKDLNIKLMYLPELFELEDTYFEGYWHNYKYLNKIQSEIRKVFSFDSIKRTDTYNYLIKRKIQQNNSVSIHIRRGDYLKPNLHKIMPLNYYKNAIKKIESSIDHPLFFIFSDEIGWAKSYFKSSKFIFVEANHKDRNYIDMQLMSLCKHHIIANSTFSWWAAWLNKHKNKIVIAPKTWRTNKDVPDSNIIPGNWIVINS